MIRELVTAQSIRGRAELLLLRAGDWHSRLALTAVILVVMILMIPPNGILNDNEEFYFQLAFKFLHPELPAYDSAIIGQRRHMIFFLAPLGFLIEWLGFEATQVLTRLTVAVLYTIALVRLFRQLEFRTLDVLLVLFAFYCLNQHILGGEWLFAGAESKTFAYPFILLSLSFALQRRLVPVVVLSAVATYFHFLAGGFWAGFMLLALLITGASFRTVLVAGLGFLALCVPLLYVIVNSYGNFVGASPSADLPPVAWITGVFRNSAHTSPFMSSWEFRSWFQRIALLTSLWLISLYFLRLAEPMRLIGWLCFLALSFLLVMLMASFGLTMAGKDYLLAAFFPFRPSSVALLLWLIVAVYRFRDIIADSLNRRRFKLAALLICSFFAMPPILEKSVILVLADQRQMERQLGLNQYVDHETEVGERFLIHPSLETQFWRFERQRNRPVLSFRKFISVDKEGVYEWYARELFAEQVAADGCKSERPYAIDYYVMPSTFSASRSTTCGEVVYLDAEYLIIRSRKKNKNGAEKTGQPS